MFTQPFCRDCLAHLNKATLRSEADAKKERAALAAGKAIAAGEFTLAHVMVIARWKSARRAALISNNSEQKLRQTLSIATSDSPLGAKLAALTELEGVGVPMASAILTAIDPGRYTVIDVRALDALGVRGKTLTPAFYDRYLTFCREAARMLDLPLRDLDRALWKAGSM